MHILPSLLFSGSPGISGRLGMTTTAVLFAHWHYEKLSVSPQEPECCCLNAVGWAADTRS